MTKTILRILDTPAELAALEALQRRIWPGDETSIAPMHLLMAAAHNGGLAIGAYLSQQGEADGEADDEPDLNGFGELPAEARLVGFVFGFPGLYFTPDGPRPKHHSHMLGVLPEARDLGIGFLLKRAQWQMVRRQGLDRITWTFDPLLSRNAYLNIARLGAVCNTYIPDAYGEMLDELNVGLPSDRFQVDWWITTQRVNRRLSKRARLPLDLGHFVSAGTELINPPGMRADGLLCPGEQVRWEITEAGASEANEARLALVEIPADFQALRGLDPALALAWRTHTRELFQRLFAAGYLVTDFVHVGGEPRRSFYVLVHGEATF